MRPLVSRYNTQSLTLHWFAQSQTIEGCDAGRVTSKAASGTRAGSSARRVVVAISQMPWRLRVNIESSTEPMEVDGV